MSGHSGFAPIGSNPPAQMPPVGGVGNNASQPANVPQGQPQVQPENMQANQPGARSLLQKLDTMLLKAADMSTKAVDDASIKKVAKTPGLSKADSAAITAAADTARQTMKAISDFTGRQIASAFVADEKGVFSWKDNAAAAAIRAAIDAQAALSEKLHDLANRPGTTGDAFDAVVNLALQCDRRQTEIASLAMQLADAAASADNDPAVAKRLDQAIDHAIKLGAEYKVVKNGDFEKLAVQKGLIEPEINAENPVKSVGDFQLPMEQPTGSKEMSKRQVVRLANRQVKSFFMRDFYGKVTKPDWFA